MLFVIFYLIYLPSVSSLISLNFSLSLSLSLSLTLILNLNCFLLSYMVTCILSRATFCISCSTRLPPSLFASDLPYLSIITCTWTPLHTFPLSPPPLAQDIFYINYTSNGRQFVFHVSCLCFSIHTVVTPKISDVVCGASSARACRNSHSNALLLGGVHVAERRLMNLVYAWGNYVLEYVSAR